MKLPLWSTFTGLLTWLVGFFPSKNSETDGEILTTFLLVIVATLITLVVHMIYVEGNVFLDDVSDREHALTENETIILRMGRPFAIDRIPIKSKICRGLQDCNQSNSLNRMETCPQNLMDDSDDSTKKNFFNQLETIRRNTDIEISSTQNDLDPSLRYRIKSSNLVSITEGDEFEHRSGEKDLKDLAPKGRKSPKLDSEQNFTNEELELIEGSSNFEDNIDDSSNTKFKPKSGRMRQWKYLNAIENLNFEQNGDIKGNNDLAIRQFQQNQRIQFPLETGKTTSSKASERFFEDSGITTPSISNRLSAKSSDIEQENNNELNSAKIDGDTEAMDDKLTSKDQEAKKAVSSRMSLENVIPPQLKTKNFGKNIYSEIHYYKYNAMKRERGIPPANISPAFVRAKPQNKIPNQSLMSINIAPSRNILDELK